jgi:ribosomal protein L11 methyltransferase
MQWQRLRARIDKRRLADVESILNLAGAVSITLEDAKDQPLLEPPPGTTPLWDHLQLEALFDASSELEPLMGVLSAATATTITITPLADQDWVAQTEALNTPIRFGRRLQITPPKLSRSDQDADLAEVILAPGLAFGSGLHPTTALCLAWLEQHPPQGQRLLDFGCGSGILALAGLKLGAERAWLVDIDPQAIVASRQNAEQNSLHLETWVGTPEQLAVTGFDLLMANILANPLIELANHFAQLVSPGGNLLLTGLLAEQEAALINAYEPHFGKWSSFHRDGWLCLHGKRSGSS